MKHSYFLLFLGLEILCFILILNYNDYHRSSFISSSNRISGNLLRGMSQVTEYFSLADENRYLALENTRLHNMLNEQKRRLIDEPHMVTDSLTMNQYFYRSARVVNHSVNKVRNMITVDKGRRNGIRKDMAVISSRGVVGIIRNVSDHFATVIPLINIELKVSARIMATGYFGSVEWDGISPQYVWLTEVPVHAKVAPGDSIVTSGYSTIFPEGLHIGQVEEVSNDKGEGFYRIKVKLGADFHQLLAVEVVENRFQQEQKLLEKLSAND